MKTSLKATLLAAVLGFGVLSTPAMANDRGYGERDGGYASRDTGDYGDRDGRRHFGRHGGDSCGDNHHRRHGDWGGRRYGRDRDRDDRSGRHERDER